MMNSKELNDFFFYFKQDVLSHVSPQSPFTVIRHLLCLFQFLQGNGQSLPGAVQLALHQLDPAVQRCHLTLSLQ